MTPPTGLFIGSEALANGSVRKHQLRSCFVAVFPDVYAPVGQVLTLRQRSEAAWLWSHREGVLAGVTAAALHGSKWTGPDQPIELIWMNARHPPGLTTFDYRLLDDELGTAQGMPATTVARTAFDVGRRGRLGDAVARLDALGSATGFTTGDVLSCAARHQGARGLRQLEAALESHDSGAQSPQETRLRLLLLRAGFPRPRTQIPVVDAGGRVRYYLDMGWEDLQVAVEYDGQHHRTDSAQYARDVRRSENLRDDGWIVVRVLKGDAPQDVIARVSRARTSRLRGDRDLA